MKMNGEEKRFKHKLNMLEPGTGMIKCIGILILAGLLFYIFRFRIVAFCMWAASGIVFAVLLVLLVIEAHQDNVMNDIAIKENRKNGTEQGIITIIIVLTIALLAVIAWKKTSSNKRAKS